MTDSFVDLDTTKMPDLSWRIARIPKKSGGMRTLHIPNDELKRVQRQVLEYLYQFETLRPKMQCVGFVPGRDTMSGLVQHDTRAMFVICMDVKDFFDNCPKQLAEMELLSAGVPATKVDYILKVCTYEGSFAQGAPSSPYLANIAMARFDAFMRAFAHRRGLTYTRYADDITVAENIAFIPSDPAMRVYIPKYYSMQGRKIVREQGEIYLVIRGIEKLLTVCSNKALRINTKKTRVAWRVGGNASRRVTGVVMRNDSLGYNAPRKFRKQTRAICHNLYMLLKDNPALASDYWPTWRKLKGCVTYCDRIRLHSLTADTAAHDPFIDNDKYNYLKGLFEPTKAKGETNDSSNY